MALCEVILLGRMMWGGLFAGCFWAICMDTGFCAWRRRDFVQNGIGFTDCQACRVGIQVGCDGVYIVGLGRVWLRA